MSTRPKDPVGFKDDVKESRLLRITEAEKKVYHSPLGIAVIILATLPILIPSFVDMHYDAEGEGNRFQGVEAFGISTLMGIAIFAAWVIVVFFAMKYLTSIFDKKLDEVERFIEYKAGAYAGYITICLFLAVWSFAMWFPTYLTDIMSVVPFILLWSYALIYLILRAKYRKQYEA